MFWWHMMPSHLVNTLNVDFSFNLSRVYVKEQGVVVVSCAVRF